LCVWADCQDAMRQPEAALLLPSGGGKPPFPTPSPLILSADSPLKGFQSAFSRTSQDSSELGRRACPCSSFDTDQLWIFTALAQGAEVGWELETSIAYIDLLYGENNSHRVWTTIQ
jgi:hypothetical protein